MPLPTPPPAPPQSFRAPGTCSVTCHCLANFPECQLYARPTRSPRARHLPDPAETVGARLSPPTGLSLEVQWPSLHWACPQARACGCSLSHNGFHFFPPNLSSNTLQGQPAPWAQTEVRQLATPQGITPPPNTHMHTCAHTHLATCPLPQHIFLKKIFDI